jgi:hypothetical protein
MPHAPLTRPRPTRPRTAHPAGRSDRAALARLRDAIADAHQLDLAALRDRPEATVRSESLQLLGDRPIRTGADATARLDALAHELLARMRAAGWDEGEAPRAVTSVLAASVPAAEAVLLRAARSRRR